MRCSRSNALSMAGGRRASLGAADAEPASARGASGLYVRAARKTVTWPRSGQGVQYILKRRASFTAECASPTMPPKGSCETSPLDGSPGCSAALIAEGSAATTYSLIFTTKMNGIALQAWLTDILARIAAHPALRLGELLPWNGTPASAISARAK